MKLRWIIISAVFVVTLGYWLMMSNPRYLIEIRELTPDGAVLYKPQRYEEWATSENIAAIRKHTLSRIYHCVYFNGLTYNFSKSGQVYAIQGSEMGVPFIYVRAWNYAGNPHDFPFYDFSARWDTGHP